MDWPIGGCCACVVRLSEHAPATWKHVNRAIRRIRRVIHDLYVLATFDVPILELPSVDEYEMQLPERRYFRKPRIGPRVVHLHCVIKRFLDAPPRIP